MHKFYPFSFLLFFSIAVIAQTAPLTTTVKQQNATEVPTTQPYGKIETSDLQLTSCDFEKDANAEVLFDKGDINTDGNVSILERHIRIKIFNDFGKNEGNIRLEYLSYLEGVTINDLQAETINLDNGKTVFTQVDKKAIYSQTINKYWSALIIAMPNVKAGSVIELKYRQALVAGYFPSWNFQSSIPTRYSEIKTDFPGGSIIRVIPHVKQPFLREVGKAGDYTQLRTMANIHSLPDEPFMDARRDNLESMEYLSLSSTRSDSWQKIGEAGVKAIDFGLQFSRGLDGESDIIKKAKGLKTDDEKIAFVFDTVKNRMKWNGSLLFYTIDGTVRAWDRGSGNSAEINLILYHLLKKTGIKSYPMVVSTRKNGKLNPANPNFYIFNSAVVFIPVDSTRQYVLDATNKYNLYNEIPTDELNTFGLDLDESNSTYAPLFLQNQESALQSVFLNAEITPDGKMSGSAEINSFSYHKIEAMEKYKTDGEEKYIKYLTNKDNNLKVSSFKLANMNIDSLPLTQTINFNNDLTGSDGNYIYFSVNMFNTMGDNPFKSDERFSDIDLGYRNNFSVNGIYKLPAGYKTDALPKSVTILMPDTSIVFKRTVAEDNGTLLIKYTLNHKKTLYFRDDYPDIRGFYKKMYELLNEQVILKKM